jgi:hypothetical protein
LLLYGLSTKHGTIRVNLWRKLKKFGAVALKTSGYVLPDEPVHYERFQWLAGQIQDEGGEATLIRVAEIEGMPNDQIAQLFNDARTTEYKELSDAIQSALKNRKRDSVVDGLEKYQRRLNEIKEIDYFHAPAGQDVEMLLRRLERLAAPKTKMARLAKLTAANFTGKTWMTRPRPGIDRAGSAWLIRKFIDSRAKFIFGMEPRKHPNALPFDMVDVEFSHHGDDCTFETLVKRFGIADKAVEKIAEMVHDTDLEDGKFQTTECIGIDQILKGWAKKGLSDKELLERGGECFDALYQQLQK